MIIGLFQRHYKIHRGASFIPFHACNPESLTAFIGNNGYGKSSILEGLDTFFNGREFNINLNEKKSQAFVAPLLLLTSTQIKLLTKNNQNFVKIISKFLWNETLAQNPTVYNPIKDFFTYRDDHLTEFKDTHYLVIITKQFDKTDSFFISFTPSIKKAISDSLSLSYEHKENNKLIAEIKALYSYIYIPVETSLEEFLKIETSGMQNLVDKKITSEIEALLKSKNISRKNIGVGRPSKLSLLDIINQNLELYIDNVESRIKKIDSEYDFRKDVNKKKKLTANDLKDQIIFSYLANRTLRKDKKPIKTLSAGERKKALVDIAYALLVGNTTRDRHIILAVDEPESSLHISNCFEQFKRIEDMSLAENCQVIITTHWYGALPIVNKGTLVHLELNNAGTPIHKRFKFRNYFEERGEHPNDIQLKSFYDLSSSIISSLRHYNTNWLIVEGSDDLNYISKFISNENINILPVGGASIVRLLYDFLFIPLAHKSESTASNGRILCLVDTDHSSSKLQHCSETKSKDLVFRRLQVINNKVELIKDERSERIPIEVEEVMHPNDMYKAISNVARNENNRSITALLKKFSVDSSANHSRIKGDDSMLVYADSATEMKKDKNSLLQFIENNKEKISQEFYGLTTATKPDWIKKIEDYFKK